VIKKINDVKKLKYTHKYSEARIPIFNQTAVI